MLSFPIHDERLDHRSPTGLAVTGRPLPRAPHEALVLLLEVVVVGAGPGEDMEALVFEADARLNITSFTQPAMVCAGIAMLEVIKKRGLNAEVCAGLSLGEYEALYYSGALSRQDALRVVGVKGRLMQKTMPPGIGTMAAVLGLNADVVQNAIEGIADI